MSKMSPSRKKQKVSEDGAAIATAVDVEDGFDPDRGISIKPKSAKQSRTLFVRMLPSNTTNESLAEFFSQSAPLKHATAVLDRDTKKCKGIGFVTFAEAEDASKAVEELNGKIFEGKKLGVEIAKPRHREVVDDEDGQRRSKPAPEALQEKEQRTQQLQAQDGKSTAQGPPRLIIRNLPWSIKEPEHLSKLFLSYGKVKEVKLPKGRNGTLKGFGFVLLRGRKNAEKAMEGINGKEVDGRTLAVDFAAPKDVWEKQQGAQAVGNEDQEDAMDDEAEDDKSVQNEEELGVVQDDEDSASDDEEDDSDAEAKELETEDSELEDEATTGQDDNASKTVFIRNLPYTVDDDELYQHFRSFGPLRYARVVMDYDTTEEGRSRGTAFVCFHKLEDVQSCLKGAPQTQQTAARQQKDKSVVKHSLLEDTQADPSGRYTIDGRVLQVTAHVGREEAQRLATEGTMKRNKEDKRRLYLLREGTIASNSPLYKSLSLPEVRMREASAKQRQTLIQKNPALHLSLTRLAIRNIPRHINSKDLKALARQAVVGFAEDVKGGKRQPLTKEELSRNREAMKEAEQERKRKGVGLVKQAKIVFESREGSKVSEGSGAGRSRGYGFVEYTSHRSALMGLRWLNGHLVQRRKETDPTAAAGSTDGSKRLIVEFAIENAQVVQRRHDRGQKSRAPAYANDVPGKNKSSDGSKYEKFPARNRDNKRKRPEEPSEKEDKDEDRSKKSKDKSALRQQIIGRKRAKRRAQKGGS